MMLAAARSSSSLRAVVGGLTTAATAAGGAGLVYWSTAMEDEERQRRHPAIISTAATAVATTRCDGGPLLTHLTVTGPHSSSLLRTTLEATMRVVRLVTTATMMAVDYKTAEFYGREPQGIDDESEDEQQRRYWEDETEKRRHVLQEVQQAMNSTNSHRKEKEAMNRDAEALAEAEEKLSTMGSSRQGLVHRKAASRFLRLCQMNKGVYIKVGQHLANLDYLIPHEYIEILSALYDDDNVPRTSYDDVRQVVYEDFGEEIEEIFDDFDPEPIASAALAQVHVAYDKKTGRKLAVKVQHRGLRETSAGDIYALIKVVHTAERLFRGFTHWGWLADEIAPQLPKELDFENEGKNADHAAWNVARSGLDCVVPKVVWGYTSPRVLCMEFEGGIKATDADAIQKMGLDKRDVARLMSSVFSSQIFLDSFVHCDPRPANVSFRANKKNSGNNKPQMILYDHGLYRELDSGFRRQYAALWKSMMLADLEGIKSTLR